MSVIAWDGRCLAADKRSLTGDLIRPLLGKVFKVKNELIGYVGGVGKGEELLAWYKGGANPAEFPDFLRDNTQSSLIVVASKGNDLRQYNSSPYPVRFMPGQHAWGSGREYALAAMYCGKTAPESIEVATKFDCGCGDGVDVLRFR